MPTFQSTPNGASPAQIYYEIHGNGSETIVFSHGLLFNGTMFHKQVDFFKKKYTCVIFDHRGQGQSEITKDGYDMETLTEDACQLIKHLGLPPCHFLGLSMGGFVGMRIAARRPELLRTLTLMETSSEEEHFKFKYRLLSFIVKIFGVKSVTSRVMPIVLGQKFLNDPLRSTERKKWRLYLQSLPKTIVRSVKAVIDRKAVIDELVNISVPTLIMVGDEDKATPIPKSETIHSYIPKAHFKILKGAGHSSSFEEAGQVNEALDMFLKSYVV